MSLDDLEPTPDDLAAIDAEWPSYAAGLEALDAEIAALYDPTPLNVCRARDAQLRAWLTALEIHNRRTLMEVA